MQITSPWSSDVEISLAWVFFRCNDNYFRELRDGRRWNLHCCTSDCAIGKICDFDLITWILRGWAGDLRCFSGDINIVIGRHNFDLTFGEIEQLRCCVYSCVDGCGEDYVRCLKMA